MLELVLWGSVQLIEVFAIIKIYKKITNESGTIVPLLQKSNGFAVAFCMIAIVLLK